MRKVGGRAEIGGKGGGWKGREKVAGESYGGGSGRCCEGEFGGSGRVESSEDRSGYRRGGRGARSCSRGGVAKLQGECRDGHRVESSEESEQPIEVAGEFSEEEPRGGPWSRQAGGVVSLCAEKLVCGSGQPYRSGWRTKKIGGDYRLWRKVSKTTQLYWVGMVGARYAHPSIHGRWSWPEEGETGRRSQAARARDTDPRISERFGRVFFP